jgi:hypothetical protein
LQKLGENSGGGGGGGVDINRALKSVRENIKASATNFKL